MSLKETSIENLNARLAEINAERDALTAEARAITAELADRDAMGKVTESVNRLSPEARATLKQAL